MAPDEFRHLRIESRDGVVLIELRDRRITESNHIQMLHNELHEIACTDGASPRSLILDFRNVEFLSSAMLSVLISLQAHVHRRSRHLVLSGLADNLQSIFRMTMLHKIMAIEPDVETAMASLPRPLADSA